MTIKVFGDWHADLQFIDRALDHFEVDGETILHLGDLGVGFIDEHHLDGLLESYGARLLFVDGNHDNHDLLATLERDDDGFDVLTERIRHIPRGHIFELNGLRIMGYGGGHSVDRQHRTMGRDLWPGENIDHRHVDRLVVEHPVDVLLTHEPPYGVPVIEEIANRPHNPFPESECIIDEWQRRFALEVAKKANPRLHLHGHWHLRHTSHLGRTEVIGLGDNTGTLNDNGIVIP